jgi:peroxiredoxin
MRELDEFKGRKVILVFFRGVQCYHCGEQLRALLQQARRAQDADAEIVAVSSRRVADLARALRLLGVESGDRFHLLVDEAQGSFRDFGCFAGVPQHGLFVIDGAGMIRALYVGEAPFSEPRAVFERIAEMAPTNRSAAR